MSEDSESENIHEVKQVRFLTDLTFILRFDRGKIQFKAGQRIIVGLKGEMNQREYSIYSGENDDSLEILVREVAEGTVSKQLKHSKPGQLLEVNGPFGSFGIEKYEMSTRKHVFIASGTGISPFHSFIKSYPEIDYVLFHGVRYVNEAYERNEYNPDRYILCTSRESNNGRIGRVTKYLASYAFKPDMLFYVCGNSSMIYDVYHLLKEKGVPAENIFSEVYF